MKKILLPFIFFCSVSVYGQYAYSPNTFYLIPPVGICDGIWAVNEDSCHFPTNTYLMMPGGCATTNHRNGDTLFLNLCYIPCQVWETCDSGGYQTGILKATVFLTTNIDDVPENNLRIINDGSNIYVDNPELNIEFIGIFDLLGRCILSISSPSNTQVIFDSSVLTEGPYIVNCRLKNKMILIQKIVIN
jgi:hypothetical protein